MEETECPHCKSDHTSIYSSRTCCLVRLVKDATVRPLQLRQLAYIRIKYGEDRMLDIIDRVKGGTGTARTSPESTQPDEPPTREPQNGKLFD